MLPKQIQVVLFSATFPDNVVKYAHTFAPNANQMTLKHEDLTVEGIKQIYLDCDDEEAKYDVLVKFYGMLTIGSSIIFVRVCNAPQSLRVTLTKSPEERNGYEDRTANVSRGPQSCCSNRRFRRPAA